METKPNIPDQLEEVGSKMVKLAEQTGTKLEPKVSNFLTNLSNWLDKKIK